MIKRLICKIFGHKRGKTKYMGNKYWKIECSRCGYKLKYSSPCARLVGKEMAHGFTGE